MAIPRDSGSSLYVAMQEEALSMQTLCRGSRKLPVRRSEKTTWKIRQLDFSGLEFPRKIKQETEGPQPTLGSRDLPRRRLCH